MFCHSAVMRSLNMTFSEVGESPYVLLIRAALIIPIFHYTLGILLVLVVFLYNFLEIHILRDFLNGFRGQPVVLAFNPSSHVYRDVVSKCKVLHGRYLPTPWLCSPHLQTLYLSFFGNPPPVYYTRQIFMTSDGGTLALDWVRNFNFEVKKPAFQGDDVVQQNIIKPIIIIIPGLTSDSGSAYVKHLAFKMAKRGWDVVVSNHRGLGGVSMTSDRSYNAGWTEDVRKVIDHIHSEYPDAPLFVVGTSIGANILVKYLGEDGLNTPIIGAAAICSPWDLLICDRFMNRKLAQRLYNTALTVGLKEYANLHEAVLSRLSNWEGVRKSLSVRDFDDSATRVLGNYETVDTYYRCCSSSQFVRSVMVPLLCISSLDDPICTCEAIPLDECRLNINVVLATTEHGGHLPFFEGLAAKSLWWVRAVDEFFCTLQSSPLRHQKNQMKTSAAPVHSLESYIDHNPYVHVLEDGMVTAISNEVTETEVVDQDNFGKSITEETIQEQQPKVTLTHPPDSQRDIGDLITPVKKCLNQLTRQNRTSFWLLAYIAIITTWPVVGSALLIFFRKKFQLVFPRAWAK